MIKNGTAQPGVSVLQDPSFLLRQARILQSRKNVIELSFHPLKFCAEHGGLRFLPLPLRMWVAG